MAGPNKQESSEACNAMRLPESCVLSFLAPKVVGFLYTLCPLERLEPQPHNSSREAAGSVPSEQVGNRSSPAFLTRLRSDGLQRQVTWPCTRRSAQTGKHGGIHREATSPMAVEEWAGCASSFAPHRSNWDSGGVLLRPRVCMQSSAILEKGGTWLDV